MISTEQYLFACGDLRQAAVQERIFGRRLAGKPDAPLLAFAESLWRSRLVFQMTA